MNRSGRLARSETLMSSAVAARNPRPANALSARPALTVCSLHNLRQTDP